MDRGVCQATVHGVASWKRLSGYTTTTTTKLTKGGKPHHILSLTQEGGYIGYFRILPSLWVWRQHAGGEPPGLAVRKGAVRPWAGCSPSLFGKVCGRAFRDPPQGV